MAANNNMRHQSAKEVIMVRPASFGFDEDTMADNAFQKVVPEDGDAKKVHEKALEEFDGVVQLLKRNGVTVITFNDNPMPAKPDAIFPNNWFSTNCDGSLFIYPMMAASRRTEQRMDIVKYLEDIYQVDKVINWKQLENEGVFLEGTGSVVFDHIFKKAYACISSRTNAKLVGQMCKHLSYEPILFEAFDDKHGKPIYHTNVLMWIGTTVTAICADAIPDVAIRVGSKLNFAFKIRQF